MLLTLAGESLPQRGMHWQSSTRMSPVLALLVRGTTWVVYLLKIRAVSGGVYKAFAAVQ